MELQDDVLQPQHQLLPRDEDAVVELALRAELPQKGLRLRVRPSVMTMLTAMGSLTAAERMAQLLYERWSASTLGLSWPVGENSQECTISLEGVGI